MMNKTKSEEVVAEIEQSDKQSDNWWVREDGIECEVTPSGSILVTLQNPEENYFTLFSKMKDRGYEVNNVVIGKNLVVFIEE